jgi:hypothetical protein
MDIVSIINDKSLKSTDKREQIADALRAGKITVQEIESGGFDEKGIGLILEAMESVSGRDPDLADSEWLAFAKTYILSKSNSLKREASRVVGNIAHRFPGDLEDVIQMLMENTKNDGTVVRWGSAYALGRIILIPEFANSDLFDLLADLAEQEPENGVRNQYLNGLKKAKKLRG